MGIENKGRGKERKGRIAKHRRMGKKRWGMGRKWGLRKVGNGVEGMNLGRS